MNAEHHIREAERLAELAVSGDSAQIGPALSKWQDAEVAEILSSLPESRLGVVYRALDAARQPAVFLHLNVARQERLLEDLDDREVRPLIEALDPDDLTRLLADVVVPTAERILGLLSAPVRTRALELLGYPEESVGRLMTPHYVAVRADWTVDQAMQHIRRRGPDSETIHTVYVVDSEGRLVDDVRLRRLILDDPGRRVADVMDYEFAALLATDDREEAVTLMRRYDLFVLPVVDRDGKLLGVVTADDVLDIQHQKATEDFHQIGAVRPLVAKYRHTSIGALFKARIPWLIILVFVGLLSTTVISSFENTLAELLVLAAFIPLLIGSGGNTGAQASTLMVRALATGDVNLPDWWRTLRKEFAIGACLGLAMGAACFALGTYIGGVVVGGIVGTAMFVIVLLANVMGMLLPFLLTRVGRDPAMASSPVITTIVDVVGLLVYFTIATWTLNVFA